MERYFNAVNPETAEVKRNFGRFISDDDLDKFIEIDLAVYEETPRGFVNYCNDLFEKVQVICKIIHNLRVVHKWDENLIRCKKILRGYDAVNNGDGVFVTSIEPYITKISDAKKSFIDKLIEDGEATSDVMDIDKAITAFVSALDEMISIQLCSEFVISGDVAKYMLCKISLLLNVSINDNSDGIIDIIIENIKTTTSHANEFFDSDNVIRNMTTLVDCAIARCDYANYMKEVVGVKLPESLRVEIEPGHMGKIYPVIKKKIRNKLIKKVDKFIDGEKIMKIFCKNINNAVESAVVTNIGDTSYVYFIEKAMKCIKKIRLVDVSNIDHCDNCTCNKDIAEISESDMAFDVTPYEHIVTGVFKSKGYLSFKDLVKLLVLRLTHSGKVYDADEFIYDEIDDNGAVGVRFIFRDKSEDESERGVYETDTYTYIADNEAVDFEKVINEVADEFILNDDRCHTITEEEIRMLQSHGPIEISVVLSTVEAVIIHEDEYNGDDDDQDFMYTSNAFKRKKNFTFEELMTRVAKCEKNFDKINKFIREAEAKTGSVSGKIEFKGDDDNYGYTFNIAHDEDDEEYEWSPTVHEIIDFLIDSGKESGDAKELTSIISRIQNHGSITVTMTFFAPAGTYVEVFDDDTNED